MRINVLLFLVPMHVSLANVNYNECSIEWQKAFKEFQRNEQKWLEAANDGEYIYYLPSEELMDWRECVSQLSNAK